MNIQWYIVGERNGVPVNFNREKKDWVERGTVRHGNSWRSYLSARDYQRRRKLGGVVAPQNWTVNPPLV